MWSTKLLLLLCLFFFLATKVSTYKCSKGSLFCHFLYNSCHIGFPVFKQASNQTCLSPIICGIFLGIYLNPLKREQIEEESSNPYIICTCSRINIQHKLLNRYSLSPRLSSLSPYLYVE